MEQRRPVPAVDGALTVFQIRQRGDTSCPGPHVITPTTKDTSSCQALFLSVSVHPTDLSLPYALLPFYLLLLPPLIHKHTSTHTEPINQAPSLRHDSVDWNTHIQTHNDNNNINNNSTVGTPAGITEHYGSRRLLCNLKRSKI